MFETIVRLTDEQEATLRKAEVDFFSVPTDEMVAINQDIFTQLRAALALYDQLVAEAKAKSDD